VVGDILQPTHLLFILVVALLVLGPKRLPEVGRALGRGIRDFRNAMSSDDLHESLTSTTSPVDPTPADTDTVAGEPEPTVSSPTTTPEPHAAPATAPEPKPEPAAAPTSSSPTQPESHAA